MNKVFCIGLPRTGTRSITAALNTLGIKTVHYPSDEETFLHLSNGFYKLPILERYQGLSDIVAAPYYAQFDETYPGSKFILTVRDKASWLVSAARNIMGAPETLTHNRQVTEVKKFFRASCYGSHRFNERRFSYVYDLHLKNARDYFKDRPGDFLVIDLCGGQGWETLCPFLNIPIPDVPFPYEGKHTPCPSYPRSMTHAIGRRLMSLVGRSPQGNQDD